MNSPTQALFWQCWRRTRHLVFLSLLASVCLTAINFAYLMPSQELLGERASIAGANALYVICLISAWLLSALVSNALSKAGNKGVGFGFPLKTEFAMPVSSVCLTTVPLLYCVLISYACFIVPVLLLTTVFGLPLPALLLHFIIIEYLLITLPLSWFSDFGGETIAATVGIVLLFYFDILVPGFSYSEESGQIVLESMSSLLMPLVITVLSVSLLFLGVSRQRSGGSLLLRSVSNQSMMHLLNFNTTYLFRWIKTPCPIHSSSAALIWRERQSRGLQAAIGMGGGIGFLVVLVLWLLGLRDIGPDTVGYEQVASFAFIFFCSVFVALLATVFGITYRNGDARVSVFDRTLPVSVLKSVLIRLGTAFTCLLATGIVEIISIGIFGPLFLDGFAQIRAEFFENISAILEQGIGYTLLQSVLLLAFIYFALVFWSVFISYFAIATRAMTIIMSTITLYLIISVFAIAALGGGTEFIRLSNLLKNFNSWLLVLAIIGSIGFFALRLLKDKVLSPPQLIVLIAVGLGLAVLQIIDLNMAEEAIAVINTPGSRTLAQVAGLLPLSATLLALWTQQRLRFS